MVGIQTHFHQISSCKAAKHQTSSSQMTNAKWHSGSRYHTPHKRESLKMMTAQNNKMTRPPVLICSAIVSRNSKVWRQRADLKNRAWKPVSSWPRKMNAGRKVKGEAQMIFLPLPARRRKADGLQGVSVLHRFFGTKKNFKVGQCWQSQLAYGWSRCNRSNSILLCVIMSFSLL